ncbi:glutaminyl-peptide cyclotransferase [Streptomyces sp. NRAIS4]
MHPPDESDRNPPLDVKQRSYSIVRELPHDTESFNFTQGLAYEGPLIYESTGLYGVSELRCIDALSGRVVRKTRLSREYFGEGVAIFGDFIYHLTLEGHGFVYRKDTLAVVREFDYDSQGWGLASDGRQIVMSNGSSQLFWLDPETLKAEFMATVTCNGTPISGINDLCVLGDRIYANIWYSDYVVEIDASGQVVGKIDFSELLPTLKWRRPNKAAVLNGITSIHETGNLLLTGKFWPSIFEVEVV